MQLGLLSPRVATSPWVSPAMARRRTERSAALFAPASSPVRAEPPNHSITKQLRIIIHTRDQPRTAACTDHGQIPIQMLTAPIRENTGRENKASINLAEHQSDGWRRRAEAQRGRAG